MAKIADIVREYFPDADDDFIELVVWEKTGFPGFWNIGVDGDTPEECFRKQLQDFANEVAANNPPKSTKRGL